MKLEPITNQPTVQAEGFEMRPLRQSDAGLIEMFASDKRVAWNTQTIPHPLPPGTVDALIARARAESRVEDIWALDASASGGSEVMGLISLTRLERAQCEVGYWVAPAFWNAGVASKALRALIEANPNQCKTYFASVFQDNPASARVLTNNGFQYLGDAETFSVARGATTPTWTYSRNLA